MSDLGCVLSVERTFNSWNGLAWCTSHKKACLLSIDKVQGQYEVGLCKDGKIQRYSVSELVLTAFVGPRPEGKEVCHFPDRDRSNNRLDNLRWDTSQNNQRDKIFHGTTTRGRKVNAGEDNGGAKITMEMAREMRRLYATGVRQVILCKMFGLSCGQVCDIVHGRAWKE